MSTLTAEQRARIERNRLAALERRKQSLLNINNNRNKLQNNQINKTNRKRKYHQIQNTNNNCTTIKRPLQQLQTNISNHISNHSNSPQKKRRKIYENNVYMYTNNTNNKRFESNNKSFKNNKNKNKINKNNLSKSKRKINLITNYLSNQSNYNNNYKLHRKSKLKSKKISKNTTKKHSKYKTNKFNKYKSNKNNKYKSNKNNNNMNVWTPLSRNVLFQRLSHSKFRSKFKLTIKEIEIVYTKDVESHAFDFIRNRLSLAYPINDGKQTPMRGHPVFIAQHATATCCRQCLSKWHYIQIGKPLTNQQIIYIVNVILHWIDRKCPRKNIKK